MSMTATATASLTRPLRWVAGRLRDRADSEHEMSFNRLVFALLIVLYLSMMGSNRDALQSMAIFLVLASGVFGHIILYPGVCNVRRGAALALDMGFMFWQMHIGGRYTAVIFPIYLWVVLGNGFRFGLRWLMLATVAAFVSFGAVFMTTAYWWNESYLSVGMLIGLVILPLYSGTLIKKLSLAKQAAEQASRAKSMFLASVSHELRTPLNAIIATSYLLQDTQLDPSRRDMARTIDTAAKSLLRLIDGILDFSRIEAGQINVQALEFDVLDLLAEVRQIVSPQARQKGLRLVFHVSSHTPLRVKGDHHRLQEILLNLAGNAVKFTHHGSVAVSVDAVAAPDQPFRLRFQVSDTGIGIAAEAQERIFDSFVQADETIINRYGGTGLGLAICKRLAEAMGGAIGLESTTGSGSTFWFTVQAETVAPLPADDTAPAPVLLLSRDRRLQETIASAIPVEAGPLRTVQTLADAIPFLETVGNGGVTRSIAVVDCRDLSEDPSTAATSLQRLGAERELSLILIDGSVDSSSLEVIRNYATTLSPSARPEDVGLALRIASLGWKKADSVRKEVIKKAALRLRVLIADDNEVNQEVLLKILERAGHHAQAVDNGEAALDELEAGEYDVVLMDVNMPVMDGIEATKMYRMTALGQKRARIIGLTADATVNAAERCRQAGMDACLTKPIEPAKLLEMMHEIARPAETAPATEKKNEVTPLSSHPRYRPAALPVNAEGVAASVDQSVLIGLVELGGPMFVQKLTGTFLEKADLLLEDLSRSVAENDFTLFRMSAHALASAGANLGTNRLVELCRNAQDCKRADFPAKAGWHSRLLVDEVETVRRAFAADALPIHNLGSKAAPTA